MFLEPIRRGQSLVELLVAVVLLAGIASGCVLLLAAQLRQVRTVVSAVEAANATRFASRLLRSELRSVVPARDVDGVGPDSSRQRVFRGVGITCSMAGNVAEVRYRGLRDPDPAKDSVVVTSPVGEVALAVAGVRQPVHPTCSAGPGERVIELVVSDTVPSPAVLLLFERGTWHLSASALRYARGRGGRQPVTAAVLDDDSSGISLAGGGAGPAAFELVLAARAAGSAVTHGLFRESHRIALLNLAFPLDSVLHNP